MIVNQEEEAEEEGEAERLADWDRAAADAAYKAEVERAQRHQQLLDEQAALVRPRPSLVPMKSCQMKSPLGTMRTQSDSRGSAGHSVESCLFRFHAFP